MRLSPQRPARQLASLFMAFVVTILVSACDLPLGADQNKSDQIPAPSLVTATAASSGNLNTADAICDATSLSTVLAPVPLPSGVAPNNVRIHYNRPDGNYADWGLHLWQINDARQYVADYPGVSWPAPLQRSGIDNYGAYFDIEASKFTNSAAAGFGFIVHPPGQNGDPGVDRTLKFGEGNEFWLRSGDAGVYSTNPLSTTPDLTTLRVHYKRYDNAYEQWGLHLWPTSGIDVSRLTGLSIDRYDAPVPLSAMPNYVASQDGSEISFDLPVLNPLDDANRNAVEFIVHGMPNNPNGGVNNKDGWNDNIRVNYAALSVSNRSANIWLVQEEPVVFNAVPDTRRISTTDARAIWLTNQLIKWPKTDTAGVFKLYYSANGQILAKRGAPVSGADGAMSLQLASTIPAQAAERFKYVGAGALLAVSAGDQARLGDALKQQMVLVQEDSEGRVLGATTTQLPGLLDERFIGAQLVDDLGVSIRRGRTNFKLWAPTAQKVTLCTYGTRGFANTQQAMSFDASTGVWSVSSRGRMDGQYYRYAVETFVRGVGLVRNLVTDPYSISLNADSQYSYIADLDSPWLMPPGWRFIDPPNNVRAQEDMSIYELHVRDFSLSDKTVSARNRGKYLAFAEWNSDGMKHLRGLARAGMTDVHLLPVFDAASTPEKNCITPVIPDAAADSEAQQAAVAAVRDQDCFNWGYDPLHYTAPDGSFSTNPDDGAARIREFRTMVMALHLAGMRVGMDVVYNHTSASGQNDRSILDRVVPGYYHRLNSAGDIERSTCCENTATENRMMGKLMIDSAKTWAVDYKISSLRFDLMGHQPRDVMEQLRDEVTAAADRPVQLIGEGWNFGEVANNARFVQASQLSLNGSGIGTFSDRAREHIRGGSGFDNGINLLRNQGYINGMHYDDNGSGGNKSRNDLMWSADMIKVGLAGSLRNYVMTTHWNATIPLEQINYNGQPAGYVLDPQEVVNYVENHDNQTLFDNNVYKLPQNTSREDRARVQILGAAINSFSQGVSYFHAGVDTLRSKSMDRNSYNSGDWFNRLDWSYADNGFAAGAPPQSENGENWSVIKPLLTNPEIKPTSTEIRWARDAFKDLIKIRSSSRLFRMRSEDEIKQRLTFYNTGSDQVATVLAGHLDGRDYRGANYKDVLYFVNVDKVAQNITIPTQAGKRYRLHPVHTAYDAADQRARSATYDMTNGQFNLPPRTAVVFVVQ
jgi:pullulanase